jgi:hypothetical protein
MLRNLPLLILAASVAACSGAGDAAAPVRNEATETPATIAPTPTPTPSPSPAAAASRVIGKKDMTLRGKPACEVDFAYGGGEAENLFWEEPCSAVTARMLSRAELEGLGRWQRLDDAARGFIARQPQGRVLYVEGSASASVYPVGTTGTYEVPVAD